MQGNRNLAAACVLIFACTSVTAFAQAYPAKPVRIIAPYPPGGGADASARIIAQALTEITKQQFIVDNRAGASGQIGTELVAHAVPDGYTLLLGNVGPNAILPASGANLPYDAIADFIPVSLVAVSQYALIIHPSLPVKTVSDLIALAKLRPNQIAFGSTGIAGGPHLAGELVNNLAGIRLLHVAYKGGGPVMNALLSGEVPVSFSTLPTVLPFGANGRLKIVAVTGLKRSPFAPDIPTIAETIPGYDVTQWYGVLAPSKTDGAIVSALNAQIVEAVERESTKQHFATNGSVATSTRPAVFQQLISSEIQKYKKIFATARIKLD